MRTLGLWGLATAMALLPTAQVAAAPGVARGSSSMTTGVAPGARTDGWGDVPDAPLRPPVSEPGGWTPGGWNGAPMEPGRPGAPGIPGEPGRPGTPGAAGWRDGGYRGEGYRGGDYRRPAYRHGDHRRGPGGPGDYPRFARGQILPPAFLSPDLYVTDWWTYGLGRPAYGQNWVRYYDDALLVNERGQVIDGRYGLDWDRGGPPPPMADAHGGYEPGNYDYGWAPPGPGPSTYTVPGGPVVVHRSYGDGTTVVVVQNPPVVTTTTTTTYEDVVVRRGSKTWRARPRCRCK